MKDYRELYGPRKYDSDAVAIILPPEKREIIKEIEDKYEESVIKCLKLFDDKENWVSGWLIITKSRIIFYLAQDINKFKDLRKIVWIIDNRSLVKIKPKIVDENVLKINGKEIIFSLDEFSPERLSQEIETTLKKQRFGQIKCLIINIKEKISFVLKLVLSKKFWLNPWTIGIGTSIIGAIILYYLFGIK